MKFWLGITDPGWVNFLSKQPGLEDVNFWRPGNMAFKAIPQGAPFVFKMKGKVNKIVGLGFFFQYIRLPIPVAWSTFGYGNGFPTFVDFVLGVERLREGSQKDNPELGCIVLTNPVFFRESDWLNVPVDWRSNTQQGVTYTTETEVGARLWSELEIRLQAYLQPNLEFGKSLAAIGGSTAPEYRDVISKVRVGQGAFRTSVTDAYQKRCSITGERTLPALEAAHIKSYSKSGPNLAHNGLLLRSDLHKLFDAGYLTVTRDMKVEVSSRIKAEFENGKEYYQFQGRDLIQVPKRKDFLPALEYVQWHNENVFNG